MSKRRRLTTSSKYPHLKDDILTIHYDPCKGQVSTRDEDEVDNGDNKKDKNLLYNVITFENEDEKEIDNDKYVLSTIYHSVKFKSEWKINFIMPLKIDKHYDLTKPLMENTIFSLDLIGIIIGYNQVYIMTYQDFKYGVDCLFGHKWTTEERENYIKYWDFPENEVEHTLTESLPPTSLTYMFGYVNDKDPNILTIGFETND